MTSAIAAEIRALPPDQQLAAALAVIEDLTGQDNPGIRYLIESMGLSVGMARILWALHRASPRILTRDQLASAHWGHGDVGYDRSIDSQVKRIRARTGLKITTVYGVGYRLDRPLRIPTPGMSEVIAAPQTARALQRVLPTLTGALAQLLTVATDIETIAGAKG